MVDSVEYDFHLLPSGIINPKVTAFIGEYVKLPPSFCVEWLVCNQYSIKICIGGPYFVDATLSS